MLSLSQQEQKAYQSHRFKYLILFYFYMGVETDYENACIVVKRGDKVVKTFVFKDFVSAKQFKPVNELRNELVLLTQAKKIDTDKLEAKNIEFFNKVTKVALKESLDFDSAAEILTTAELGNFAEECLIFLVNWSSTEAVKQFAIQYQETTKKEEGQ